VEPSRGEIWITDLDPTRGHEQAGTRPCLVISVDPFNRGRARLTVVVPLTRTGRNIPTHVEVNPPEGGLIERSFAKCEDVRSISKDRLRQRLGVVSAATLGQVEMRLRFLLGL
jgi:mRNA interferase MazF